MSAGPEKAHTAKPPVQTSAAKGSFFRKAGDETFFGAQESKSFFPAAVQPKLDVSQPDDPQEKEADAVADTVMRMEAAPADAGAGPKEEEAEVQRSPLVQRVPMPALLSRQAGMGGFASHSAPEEDSGAGTEVQAKSMDTRVSAFIARSARGPPAGQAGAPNTSAPQSFEASLASSKGSGSPLPSDTRQSMESRFGADFGGVRIHTGSSAESLSAGISAQAFTHGNDIYFNSGKFNPNSDTGSHLLAHELTHTIQQGASPTTAHPKAARSIQRQGLQRRIQRQEAGTQRNAAVEMAKAEVGKVSANKEGPDGLRLGWERLLEFFKTTFGSDKVLPEGAAFQQGYINEAQIKKKSTFLGDVKGGDGIVTLHNQPRDAMASWCGIFAFWALNKGGIPLRKWVMGGSMIPAEAAYPKDHVPKAGDIAYRQEFSHYALVASSDGSNVTSINGNTAGDDNVGGEIQVQTHPKDHWFSFIDPTMMMEGALRAPNAADTPGAAPARSLKELRKQKYNVNRKAEGPAPEDKAVEVAPEEKATQAAPVAPAIPSIQKAAEPKPQANEEEEKEEKVQSKTDLAARKEATADSGAEKEIDRAAEAPQPEQEKEKVQAKADPEEKEGTKPKGGDAVQRSPMSLHNRGPPRAPPVHPAINAKVSRRIQRWSLSGAWDAVSGAISDAAAWVAKGLDKAKEWMLEQVKDFVANIKGYKMLCLILGSDPITGTPCPMTGENLLEAGLDIMPFGGLFRALFIRLGIYEDAAGWLQGRIDDLSSTASGIVDRFDAFFDSLSLDDIGDPDGVLERVANLFKSVLEDIVGFIERSATSLLDMIKKVMVREIAAFIKEKIPKLYPLLCVALGFDPQTMKDVPRNGTNILTAFLAFSDDGEQEKKQMMESGTFQKAAAFIDKGILVFTTAYAKLKAAIAGIWNFVTIQNLSEPVQTFERIYASFADPIGMVTDYVIEVAAEILRLIKDAILGKLSDFARKSRGFPLLCVILGKDPFTKKAVPRTVHNLVKGFMSLMDGGEQQYEQLAASGAIDSIVDKIEAAVDRLNLTPTAIINLFLKVWTDLSIRDLARPLEAFKRIVDTLAQPLFRVIRFIIEIVLIVIEAVLILMSFPFDIVQNILTKARQAWDRIKADPIGFFKNLLACIKQGFIQFFDNIATHLINGVVGWLMSELKDAGVPLLKDFSLQGVISWVLEVLNITMEKIWEKLAAHPKIGPQKVAKIRSMINTLEGIWTFIKDVQERGMAAIWDKIQEQLSNLWDKVLDMVKSWIMEKIVAAVVTKLLSMLDPTGIMAVINSCIAIYKAVQSFIKYVTEMLRVVNSFVEGLLAIAEGNIKVGADALEGAMGRAMPIIIGFLANQVGLGGIGAKIAELIGAARDLVDKAITWLVNKCVDTAFALIEKVMSVGRSVRDAVLGWFGLRKEFTSGDGKRHKLYWQGENASAKLIVESTPTPIEAILQDVATKVADPANASHQNNYNDAVVLNGEINTLKAKLAVEANYATPAAKQTDYDSLNGKMQSVAGKLETLLPLISGPTPPEAVLPAFVDGVSGGGFEAQFISSTTGGGQGAEANNGATMPGWGELSRHNDPADPTKTIRERDNYVKMHLLHDQLGGKATDSNLAPCKSVYNTQFYNDCEQYAVQDKPSKVMWYSFTISFWGAVGPVAGIDYSPYPRSFTGRYGHMEHSGGQWRKANGGAHKKQYNASSIPVPDFSGGAREYEMNSVGATTIATMTHGGATMDSSYAAIIAHERTEAHDTGRHRKYSSYPDMTRRLEARQEKRKAGGYDQGIQILAGLKKDRKLKFN